MRSMAVVALAAIIAAGACGKDDGASVREVGGATGSATGSATASATGSATGHATGSAAAFAREEADSVLEVRATEYAFAPASAKVQGPKVFIELRNEGADEHELEVLGPDGRALGEVHETRPKATGTAALTLEPGTYGIVCRVKTGGKTHEELGMRGTLTVT